MDIGICSPILECDVYNFDMNFYFRRFILIFSIFVFLIGAFLLSFYAVGYRFNFSQKKIVKIGLLKLKTDLENFSVSISQKKYLVKKEFQKELLPKKYIVKIEKENYLFWQKEIEIFSQKITDVGMINLFLKNPSKDILILDEKIESFKLSPNNQKMVLLSIDNRKFSFKIIDLSKDRLQSDLIEFSDVFFSTETDFLQNIFYQFSEDSQKIFVGFLDQNLESQIIVFNLKDLQKKILIDNPTNQLEKIKWHSFDNDRLFVLNQENLSQIDIKSGKTKVFFEEKIADYFLDKGNIFFIGKLTPEELILSSQADSSNQPTGQTSLSTPVAEQTQAGLSAEQAGENSVLDGKYYLGKMNLDGSKKERLIELKHKNFQIFSYEKNLALFNFENKELFFLKGEKEELKLKKIEDNVEKVFWTEEKDSFEIKNNLVFQKENEIWQIIGIEKNQNDLMEKKIVFASKEKIKKIDYLLSLNCLLIVFEKKIGILELNGKNFFEILDFNVKDSKAILNKEGEKIFFIDEKNRGRGIYETRIR